MRRHKKERSIGSALFVLKSKFLVHAAPVDGLAADDRAFGALQILQLPLPL